MDKAKADQRTRSFFRSIKGVDLQMSAEKFKVYSCLSAQLNKKTPLQKMRSSDNHTARKPTFGTDLKPNFLKEKKKELSKNMSVLVRKSIFSPLKVCKDTKTDLLL